MMQLDCSQVPENAHYASPLPTPKPPGHTKCFQCFQLDFIVSEFPVPHPCLTSELKIAVESLSLLGGKNQTASLSK